MGWRWGGRGCGGGLGEGSEGGLLGGGPGGDGSGWWRCTREKLRLIAVGETHSRPLLHHRSKNIAPTTASTTMTTQQMRNKCSTHSLRTFRQATLASRCLRPFCRSCHAVAAALISLVVVLAVVVLASVLSAVMVVLLLVLIAVMVSDTLGLHARQPAPFGARVVFRLCLSRIFHHAERTTGGRFIS